MQYIPEGYCPIQVTKDIQTLFTSNLAGINAKLGRNCATVFVDSVYSQLVAGTNYLAFATGGDGTNAVVDLFVPLL
jgi:hypothetical protein